MARKKTSTTSRKTKRKKKSSLDLKSTFAKFKGQKGRRVFGLGLLVFGLLVTISYVSYLSTWESDQSLLLSQSGQYAFDRTIEVENAIGKLGAFIAHKTFYMGFGLGSFALPFLMFFFGLRVLAKRYVLPVWQVLGVSTFIMVWASISLAYIFPDVPVLGGVVGYESSAWGLNLLGSLGVSAVLFIGLASFIIVLFNPQFEWVHSLADRIGQRLATIGESEEVSSEREMEEAPVASVEHEAPVSMELSQSQLEVEEDVIDQIFSDNDDPVESSMESSEMETEVSQVIEGPAPADPTDPSSDSSDEEFSVEVAAEEVVLSEEEINEKVKEFGEYDPKLDLSSFEAPGIDLLVDHGGSKINVSKEELEANKNRIVETLANYKIGIAKIKATIGPTVTLYELVPEAGVRISKIKNLEDDIALSLAALGIRIIAPIPGRGTIGIEVPNSNPDTVSMKTVIASDKFQNSDHALPVALGKTISNETFVTDLAKMPHLLMAGATGQGKSVGLNAILVSLLYKKHPSQIKFVLVDPKKVELTLFNKIERHYLAKLPGDSEAIITDTSQVVTTLNSLCVEMDQRYDLLKAAQVRNIKEYNAKFVKRKLNPEEGHRYMPYIVLVVDEFADLIMTAGKEVEGPIARLAQLARAIGIHLIIATQRPSVNIITGTIKANFPARIAFRVTSKIDSRTILDAGGADQLIGRGDMLFSTGSDLIRLQCAFVDTPEVEEICEFIGSQRGYPEAFLLPEYVDENASEVGGLDAEDRDVLFEEAARVIVMHQQGSTSLLQRKLKLGYNRAGRLVDQLEAAGIIGPFEGSKARKVLIPDEYTLEQYLTQEKQSVE